MNVSEIMTRNPSTVTPASTVREVAKLMKDEDVGIVPIVENESSQRLLGVVTDRDIAIRVVAEGRDGQTQIRDVMSSGNLLTCGPNDSVDKVMETMGDEQVRRIPIVDENGMLVGIVAQADVVRKGSDDKKAERTIEKISEPSK